MITFSMPPSQDRYIAEIKNLLSFSTRPLCISGPPRVHIWELRRILHGKRNSKNSFIVGSNLITLSKCYTYITLKSASIQHEGFV